MASNQEHVDSGHVGYYTPQHIIEAARETLSGVITLDPASCAEANERVRAEIFFTEEMNGLTMPWFGTVWMNHPFSRNGNKLWIDKLVESYQRGAVTAACCITWASMPEAWFRPLLAYPQCFPHGRVRYVDSRTLEVKREAPKGSVITYLGPDVARFAEAFKNIGTVKVAL